MYRWWSCSLLLALPLVFGDAPSVFQPAGVVPLTRFGNKDYYFSYNFKANFFQADQVCKDINMRLVTIPSKEVNDFLYKTVSAANSEINFWTSGSNLVDKSTWMWLSNAKPIVYANWNAGQPTASALRCVVGQLVRNKDFLWVNLDCNSLYNFICESIDQDSTGQAVSSGSWANLMADPSVSPNFPLFHYNQISYYANSQPLSFLNADRFCRMIDMELVSIESEAENTWLYRWLRSINIATSFWTGGTNLINGIDWIWFPSGRKVIYTKWMKGQPDNVNERCIQLVVNRDIGMEWNNLGCDVAQPFICQSPSAKITRCPVAEPLSCNSNCGNCDASCKPGPVFQEVSYKVLSNPVNHQQASEACKAVGMSLVSIQTKEKNDAVNKAILDSHLSGAFYTSGYKDPSGVWYWSKEEAVGYTSWNAGEPNNARKNEDCLTVFTSASGALWNDVPCDSQLNPICEKVVISQPIQPEGSCCKAPVVNVFVNNDGADYQYKS